MQQQRESAARAARARPLGSTGTDVCSFVCFSCMEFFVWGAVACTQVVQAASQRLARRRACVRSARAMRVRERCGWCAGVGGT